MGKRDLDDGEVTHKEVTPYRRSLEVKRAQTALDHLLRLHERDGKLPDDASPGALEQARQALTQLKATDTVALMLTTNAPPEVAHVAQNRARRALYALAPVVAMRLADKLDDASAPGSERILVEVAKGLGLLVPGAPLDQGQRKEQITERDLADLSEEELNRMLNEQRGGSDG